MNTSRPSGIAAFMIVFYHLDIVYRIHGHFVRGYLFVDMFFLLSGFVLAVSTEKKLNAGIGAIDALLLEGKREATLAEFTASACSA